MTAIHMDFSDDELNAIKVLAKVNRTSPEQIIIDTCREALKGLFENPLEYILNHIDDSPAEMVNPTVQETAPAPAPAPAPVVEPKPKAPTCRGSTYNETIFNKYEAKICEWMSNKTVDLDTILNKLIVEVGTLQNPAQYRASKANLRYWLTKQPKVIHPSKREWSWIVPHVPVVYPTNDRREEQVPSNTVEPVEETAPKQEDKSVTKREPAQLVTVKVLENDPEHRNRFWAYLFKLDVDDSVDPNAIIGLYPEYQRKSVEKAVNDLLAVHLKRGLIKHNSVKNEWKFTSRGKYWLNSLRNKYAKA